MKLDHTYALNFFLTHCKLSLLEKLGPFYKIFLFKPVLNFGPLPWPHFEFKGNHLNTLKLHLVYISDALIWI